MMENTYSLRITEYDVYGRIDFLLSFDVCCKCESVVILKHKFPTKKRTMKYWFCICLRDIKMHMITPSS